MRLVAGSTHVATVMRAETMLVVCRNAAGEPDCWVTSVTVSEAEYACGVHYDKAEQVAEEQGYEAPFVCFDAAEQGRLATALGTNCQLMAVVLDGGLVQDVVADQPAHAPAVMVIDYDVDSDDEQAFPVRQADGSYANAWVSDRCATKSGIDLNALAEALAYDDIINRHNRTLFNHCKRCEPPDWRQYQAIDYRPVVSNADTGGDTACTALGDDEAFNAEFWTVYGQRRDGPECIAITDVPTQQLAKQIARMFCLRYGLKALNPI